MTSDNDLGKGVKSAERSLDILEYLAGRSDGVTFREIVEHLALPRSSAHGLISTLLDRGWITGSERGQGYRLGIEAWRTGLAFDGHRHLVHVAEPHMIDLSGQLLETIQLARLEGDHNVYIAIAESPRPMRLVSAVGMRLPSYATGIGKALLSLLDDDEIEARVSEDSLLPLTRHTATSMAQLLDRVGEARARGYALDDEEYAEDCRCVAVVVASESEIGFPAALSVTAPTSRTTKDWPSDVLPPLLAARQKIRNDLGLLDN